MDILQTNMRHLLPGQVQGADERLPVEGGYNEKYSEDLVELLKLRDDVLEALTALSRGSRAWNCSTKAKILHAAELACLSVVNAALETEEKTFLAPLTVFADVLQQMVGMGQLFRNDKQQVKYMRAILRSVKSTKAILCELSKMDDGLEEYQREMSEYFQPHKDEPEKDKLLWPAWSSNTVGVGCEEQRKAIIGKTDFKAIASYLPRGGCAIVEQWRTDVDEVVQSILQVKRSSEAEAQSPTTHQTYLVTISQGEGNLTRTTRTFDQPPGHLEEDSSMRDHISAMGRTLGCLDGLEPQIAGQQPFGLWETTYMKVARMKEGRKERASKLEDFGRTW